MKQPKPSHSSFPHETVENADESSTRAVKVWSDPLKAKDRKRRAAREKKRRQSKKSDSGRLERVLGNIIDLHAGQSGADLTQAEARASLVQEVIAKLNPPKKKETVRVVD